MMFTEREFLILRRTVEAFKNGLEKHIAQGNTNVTIQPQELEEILKKIENQRKGAAV